MNKRPFPLFSFALALVLACRDMADIILPLHEPRFANGEPIG